MNAVLQTEMEQFLKKIGIKLPEISYQLDSENLVKASIENNMGCLTSSGALAVNTGRFTGRSPKDRYIVKDEITADQVWWGPVNIPFCEEKFEQLTHKVISYLNERAQLYVRDCTVGAIPEYAQGVRVINEYPWSNLFALNMFLRPREEELANFTPDWLVINAPGFLANPEVDGTRQENFSILNFSKKIALIGGSAYTGEIKKGIFSAMNFELPLYKNTLPMHCSANVGPHGDTAIFFGLSGTGKTTLSADPNRRLIGDDEHGWTAQDDIFNFEGGCYAKVIDLSMEKEPDIFKAIKKGALLENVVISDRGEVDYTDASVTQNTRVSYPIDHIEHIMRPSVGKNPSHIFFLTADAFGVLPPISKLTPSQAAYHFMSGYTAKVAGTEAGVLEPTPEFSACFGAPFMPLHPGVYAQMLSDKIKASGVHVWMVNTGWVGGPYGVGSRIKLSYTRAMIQAALSGDLGDYSYENYHIHSVFGVAQPRKCPGVPSDILSPRTTWGNDEAYYKTAFSLSNAFRENFNKFQSEVSEEIRRGGPQRYGY